MSESQAIQSIMNAELEVYRQKGRVLELEADNAVLREQVKRLSTCGTDHSTPWWQVRCEDLEAQLATLQAQLRQVEGQSKQQAEEAVIVFAKYTTLQAQLEQVERERDKLRSELNEYTGITLKELTSLLTIRQLVEALPVLDMRFDNVAVGPLGWTVGGVTFGKVTEANAYSALLQYRATLAAGKEVENGDC